MSASKARCVTSGGPSDHEGEVLESFVTKERDKAAALKFLKKLMKRHGCARVVTTDGLRSYKAAMKDLGCAEKQEVGRWANRRRSCALDVWAKTLSEKKKPTKLIALALANKMARIAWALMARGETFRVPAIAA
jgi:transposase-like protein